MLNNLAQYTVSSDLTYKGKSMSQLAFHSIMRKCRHMYMLSYYVSRVPVGLCAAATNTVNALPWCSILYMLSKHFHHTNY